MSQYISFRLVARNYIRKYAKISIGQCFLKNCFYGSATHNYLGFKQLGKPVSTRKILTSKIPHRIIIPGNSGANFTFDRKVVQRIVLRSLNKLTIMKLGTKAEESAFNIYINWHKMLHYFERKTVNNIFFERIILFYI